MKKFLLALICVLLTAGFAFAVDVDIKGMYYARGSYLDNDTGLGDGSDEAYDYFFFDHELDITTRLLVTDKTRIVVNFEIRDESWLAGNTDGEGQSVSTTANTAGTAYEGRDLDDNIEFKRVFSSHTFDAYGTVLDLGLMTGGAWHTGFGDNGNGRYRVKVTQPTELGPVIGIYEKNAELGATSGVKDGEKDDYNAYYLAMVTKLGPVNLYPLIGYLDNSADILDQGSDGYTSWLVLFGAGGTHGDFGWEAEFNYFDFKQDNGVGQTFADDTYKMGIYGNGWMNIGAGKVGLLAAYGSWDNDAGYGFGMGEDFTPTVFGADQTTIGGSPSLSEYYAVSMIQLYGSLALSEELSINGAGLYWASNADENSDGTDNAWKDSDGYEINLGLDWKLTDQVTYTIASGFGKISLDSNAANAGQDPDSFARVYHRFKIDF